MDTPKTSSKELRNKLDVIGVCFSIGEAWGLMKLERLGVPVGFRCETVNLEERTLMDLRDISKEWILKKYQKVS